ncbi:TetR/AcrR family transcriptional regulator [Rhodococcus opacus]|uniref:Putative TetR family transcriptional regulator n=1 Tax=Rhodococcus opacus (strain B4) TaxID=632772 RepID=C1B218_RHOOB|nr:TetR/AcrR family transcriptional regulator [Rhodococcus opacus]BAH50442.1 putative TetR family transcriptional regulator [Rhodococcus opacus B4]
MSTSDSVGGARAGKRTGRPRSLSEDDIVQAALADDLSTLTMPAVARRLGVSHSTIYRYFPDREALLRACVDHVARSMDWPDPELDWRELLLTFADRLWASFEQYPGLAQVELTVPGTPSGVVDGIETLVLSLHRQGFSTRDALLVVDFVAELTMTQFSMMGGLDDTVSPTDPRTAREAYQDSWRDSPVLAQALGDDSTWQGRGWMQDKLALVLDGLALRRL